MAFTTLLTRLVAIKRQGPEYPKVSSVGRRVLVCDKQLRNQIAHILPNFRAMLSCCCPKELSTPFYDELRDAHSLDSWCHLPNFAGF